MESILGDLPYLPLTFPDFRYCLRADITEGRTEIKLPSGLENTIIDMTDFRSNPCDSLDYGEEEGKNLNKIGKII